MAQNTGIAGVVKDSSGAVLPGTTVEAASPALIEKVRSVVSDSQGVYSIIDLRPGVYTVTFTLPGFTTVRREGVELAGAFTATVNAELRVGAVEETITVTGLASTVDTHNVVQQRVLSGEERATLPTGRHTISITELIPGVTTTGSGHPTGHDVAGVAAQRGSAMIHGSKTNDFQSQVDGVPSTLGGGTGSASWQATPSEVQEMVFETGGMSAEQASGGVRVNVIPKEGGNRFTGAAYYSFANDSLQSNNINQRLKDLQLTTPNSFKKHHDVDVSGGGPIKRDSVWFFSSLRHWGKQEQVAGMFRMVDPRAFYFDPRLGLAGNADPTKPAYNTESNRSYGTRITWQATPRNKFGFYAANQPRGLGPQDGNKEGCACAAAITGLIAYEAGYIQPNKRNNMVIGTYKAPVTSKVLVESTVSYSHINVPRTPGPEQQYMWDENIIAVSDTGTGYFYRGKQGAADHVYWRHHSVKSALSYVTGSHAMKVGGSYEFGGTRTEDIRRPGGVQYIFVNHVPSRINVFNEPYVNDARFAKWGFFAQDQWTLGRFTLNGGIRYDQHIGSVGAGWTSGPNAYAPLREWPAVKDVPNWKDISPRVGVAYDLFGNGQTAVKFIINRYVVNESTTLANTNPILFNQSANRSWDDRTPREGGIPNDFIPQEAELGSLSNPDFGTAVTTSSVDDAVREGWGVRQNNWEASASIQHQLFETITANFAFTRRWYNNFTTVDNRAVTPQDYDEFCITAPTDPRLGDVSGSSICGLYDITAAARSRRQDNLTTSSSKFGEESEIWQGIDLTVSARVAGRGLVQGGLNSGTQGNNINRCYVVDSPGSMRFCDVQRPWQNSVKFLGSVELPWGVSVGATFQRLPQPEILANYSVNNAAIASGIVKFVNPARTSFASGTATVSLIEPGSRFLPYLYQTDLRMTKVFQYGRVRGQVAVSVANLLNGNAIQRSNDTYGTSWLRPTYILEGRVIKPEFRISF
jgi:hypothetical protein